MEDDHTFQAEIIIPFKVTSAKKQVQDEYLEAIKLVEMIRANNCKTIKTCLRFKKTFKTLYQQITIQVLSKISWQ